jgi:hypothetical protein
MARPSADVLFTKETAQGQLDILSAQGTWLVCYNNKPIALRLQHWTVRGPAFKYPRTMFANPAHAHRLARRLNKEYNTELFTVKEI